MTPSENGNNMLKPAMAAVRTCKFKAAVEKVRHMRGKIYKRLLLIVVLRVRPIGINFGIEIYIPLLYKIIFLIGGIKNHIFQKF